MDLRILKTEVHFYCNNVICKDNTLIDKLSYNYRMIVKLTNEIYYQLVL
jgi:hypothetical protein